MNANKLAKSAVLAFSALAMVVACGTEVTEQDTTNSLLTVVSILPTGEDTNDLTSDVCSNEAEATPFAGGFEPTCTVTNDVVTVVMTNRPKAIVSSLGSTYYNDVTLTRYRVTYVRSDGRNTPGVDVPYPFDGAANVNLPIGVETGVGFDITVVRQSAKLEPPLANMAGNGGEIVLSTIAEIDFFGTDVAGKAITVRGYLNVTFADF